MNMGKAKRYTEAEMEFLRKNPNVKSVRENRLTLTFEFRTKLYEALERGERVRDVLERNGIPHSIVGCNFEKHLKENLKIHGKPVKGNGPSVRIGKISSEDNEKLLKSEIFVKKNNGISFSEAFVNEMYAKYPDVDIVQELRDRGIDPDIVGYRRIYSLKRRLAGKKPRYEATSYSDEVIDVLSKHPYVQSIIPKKLRFKKVFFQKAYLLSNCHINDILKAFEIDPEWLTISVRNNIMHKLRNWKSDSYVADVYSGEIKQLVRIEKNLNQLMESEVEKNFLQLKETWLDGDYLKKKALCQWIQDFSKQDIKNLFPISKLIKLFGISHSNFYAILKNPNYGMSSLEKEMEDAEDIERIRRVIAYKADKDRSKGTRMVTMMLPRVECVTMSRRKVQRLMRKAGLLSKVRKTKSSREAARELLKRNCKKNLLKRKFRIHKPMESFLTDVTYLKYKDDQTAYLSPVKDSVTGMITTYQVSETQDLEMTDKMLDGINKGYGTYMENNAMFHSDQGSLYLTDHFQDQIKKLGMRQSMSRRGNCWDNASMESFFGHFKDEVDYSDCSFMELCHLVDEYVEYYNMERPQWNRNKMTPFEYWVYLNNMSDDEHAEHLKKEEKKYKKMMKKSREKAIQHAKDLGCVIPSNNKESEGKKK